MQGYGEGDEDSPPRTGVLARGTTSRHHAPMATGVLSELMNLWRSVPRALHCQVDPILSSRERCALSHKLFHRTGLLNRALQAGGIKYVLHLLWWKLKQVTLHSEPAMFSRGTTLEYNGDTPRRF